MLLHTPRRIRGWLRLARARRLHRFVAVWSGQNATSKISLKCPQSAASPSSILVSGLSRGGKSSVGDGVAANGGSLGTVRWKVQEIGLDASCLRSWGQVEARGPIRNTRGVSIKRRLNRSQGTSRVLR